MPAETGAADPTAAEFFWTVMDRGGIVMWPLLVLSLISLTLILERSVFWILLHAPSRLVRLGRLNAALRTGDRAAAEKLIRRDGSVYARVAERLLDEGASDAVVMEAVEAQRPRLDRFTNVLSTIITAAPMLGILGTVTGIIEAFDLIGSQTTLTDPRMVSGGIAEALITTAAGLIVALLTLFPYMIFRAQADRALGRLEVLVAAARQGAERPRPSTA